MALIQSQNWGIAQAPKRQKHLLNAYNPIDV